MLNLALGNLWLEMVSFESESHEKSAKFAPGQSVAGNGQLLIRIKLLNLALGSPWPEINIF